MNNSLTYKMNGDYQIPNLELSQTVNQLLGKYGRMRKSYLKQYRPVIYSQMLLWETLYLHLAEIEQTANSRIELMMSGLMQVAGVTERLKTTDQMMRVGLMNNCKAQAEKIVLKELIHS